MLNIAGQLLCTYYNNAALNVKFLAMIVFLLILLLIIIYGLAFSGINRFNEGYLRKENTTAVNGIFVFLIVLSHYAQYADLSGAYDAPYLALREHLGQMVVVPFLFYSGYGMMESIKNKGEAYVRKILSKFWQLLLRFDAAVLLFLCLNKLLGIEFPMKDTLLAFTTWTAIGNSNWYITAILAIYIIMFVSFGIGFKLFADKAEIFGAVLTLILTIAWMWFQMKIDMPSRYYNTIIMAPMGMLYSKYKRPIEKAVMKNDITYYLAVAVMLAVYILAFFRLRESGIEGYTVWAVSFMMLLLLFTMKVRVHNDLLEWLGTHIFSIYILQRIPMIILDYFGLIEAHKYISLVAVFALTIPLALIFEKLTDLIIKGLTHQNG